MGAKTKNERDVLNRLVLDGREAMVVKKSRSTVEVASAPPKTAALAQQGLVTVQPSSAPQSSGAPLEPTAIAYLLKESELMNERVRWYLEQQEKIETQGLFASGAVWAFILSRPLGPPWEYVSWLPLLLTSVLFVKSLLFTEALKESFQYIEKLETLNNVPEGMGWAHYFRLHGRKLKRRWRKAFWVFLILGNLAAALLLTTRHLWKW